MNDAGFITPLYCAVTWGHVAIVRLLLERRADPNLCVKNGFSVLNSASLKGYTEIVDLLVHAGADIHLASSDCGLFPLELAA
ncbi:Ankyrin-2, partial [Geodia barretti]